MKKKKKGLMVFLVVSAFLYLVPVVQTITRSMRYGDSVLTFRQFQELLITDYTSLHYFWNSVLYAVAITAVCLTVSFPLGFLFAKIHFVGREILFYFYIVVMLLPFQATILPNFIGLRDMKLLNTPLALMLPQMFSPLAVFLFRQFIVGIDDEVLKAALLETSSAWDILRYVVLPQTKDAFVALGVLIFCESWNMVDQVLVFAAKNDEIWPMSVMLTKLPEDVTYAGAVVYMYPVLILFLFFRNLLSKSVEKLKW